MAYGCDQAIVQLQTIIRIDRRRLICESSAMQRAVKPLTAAVSGEHPACSVGTVGCGRKSNDEELGLRVSEVGNWAPMVVVVPIGSSFFLRYLFAVGA